MKKLFTSIFFALWAFTVMAQQVNPKLLSGQWPANWIYDASAPARDYGIFHFRKTFELPARPSSFVINVSADNRYRLFVNGTPVCSGPARGDLYNWYFETLDIAPYLQPGKNVIAALVWNMGTDAPVAQVSNQTGFVLQGNGEQEKIVNTDNTWRVLHDTAYAPCSQDNGTRLRTYMVIGPGDKVNGSAYPWNWEKPAYDDSKWHNAKGMGGAPVAGYGTDNRWTLVPRNIPLMEETLQRIPKVARAKGVEAASAFLDGKHPLTIPANATVTILLDQSFNTVAYPQLLVSKGAGSSIKITYAEALYNNHQKAHRDKLEGMEIMGNYDIFAPDGGEQRMFRPLWLRTFRYLQLDITTGAQPLVINDLYGMYTGYPFEEKASFTSSDPSLTGIWEVGWRTARLCAGETYYDCPYYEQLQYEGDTRIQSLISLYVTGDDRLMRKAIHDFYCSRVPEGLTQGRYPSNRLQVIPPFSLYFISMLHDYYMHRKDDQFISQYLTAMTGILNWYAARMDSSKQMLGPMKWWNFTDWNNAFPMGTPDGAEDGNSSIISLQYAYTLQQAADLYQAFGNPAAALAARNNAAIINKAVYTLCFNASRNAMANTPLKNTYSQHAGIIAVLSGAIPAAQQQQVLKTVMGDASLSQATAYYRFYLMRALKKAGLADMYYEQLQPWREMLKLGLTTFAEKDEPTRSDCHAWSASPNYDFLATICGIMPGSPGFATVRIEPALGGLSAATGKMPIPAGEVSVALKRNGAGGITADIILPKGVTGAFVWKGRTVKLKEGAQQVKQ
ncbi:alpha-L-rhamnosidase C-terminal domain-containing protein [uncultured Chitinophaga sp.]|uniref:alpha-L-rhamnosidase-related protein n=1 Tax=uncultured Chitinophaga sp. TaxID=339340 RepID=UPI0025EECCC7|nr:alpha-L-rhamnosidase C-terminal domain-containing protein [uncultured Chitinophaga sp.]